MAQVQNKTFTQVTLTNADTDTSFASTVNADRTNMAITFNILITKTSGTVAGTLDLYASNDGGTTWFPTGETQKTITDVATQTFVFGLNQNSTTTTRGLLYRVNAATTGTQVCTMDGSVVILDDNYLTVI
jgi:hypothetical protein